MPTRVIQVIEAEFNRGEGCCEQDPVRRCRAYFLTDGTLLAVHDDWLDGEPAVDSTEPPPYPEPKRAGLPVSDGS